MLPTPVFLGFPCGSAWYRICLQCARRFDPWFGKISWRREWQPTPVFLPEESHGQKSLVSPSPWGHKESDLTERLTHIVKGFSEVNEAEVDVFLELSCFFNDSADVGNLISGSSAFSKSSLNIWKFMVHTVLKPGLENFEHYFASM